MIGTSNSKNWFSSLVQAGLNVAALLALSFVLTSLSVFLPVTVHNRIELKQVHLGFPLSFIIQSQIGLPIGIPDAPSFPVRQTLISPWEHTLEFIGWRFLLDIAIIFIALNLISLVTWMLRKAVHAKQTTYQDQA